MRYQYIIIYITLILAVIIFVIKRYKSKERDKFIINIYEIYNFPKHT